MRKLVVGSSKLAGTRPDNLWQRSHATTGVALGDIVTAMEQVAPPHLAESWDNVGLLSGSPKCRVAKVLLTIDITPAVRDEALALGADLVLSYHPAIFKPLNNLRFGGNGPAGNEAPSLAVELACQGVWIYAPHTALDTVAGGTNDVLAAAIGAKITGSFSNYPGRGNYLKLVTFIPERDVEKVADALFAAGCGQVGGDKAGADQSKYTRCSFRSAGTGTFQGDEQSNPAVGQRGVYERVPEIRFETILPAAAAADVVAALKASHPYEVPAFDLLKMETPPEEVGLGRYAELDRPLTLAALAQRCKQALGVSHAQVVQGRTGAAQARIQKLALVAGSAGRMGLDQARQHYDCLITGELKHHHMLAYAGAGIAVVCLGHGNTERPVLKMLQKRLANEFPKVAWKISRTDRDPFIIA
ncbi:MAG: Nif3-like dinuclear metal center hexameric protein [Phycisphaerae bacterium]